MMKKKLIHLSYHIFYQSYRKWFLNNCARLAATLSQVNWRALWRASRPNARRFKLFWISMRCFSCL